MLGQNLNRIFSIPEVGVELTSYHCTIATCLKPGETLCLGSAVCPYGAVASPFWQPLLCLLLADLHTPRDAIG